MAPKNAEKKAKAKARPKDAEGRTRSRERGAGLKENNVDVALDQLEIVVGMVKERAVFVKDLWAHKPAAA